MGVSPARKQVKGDPLENEELRVVTGLNLGGDTQMVLFGNLDDDVPGSNPSMGAI